MKTCPECRSDIPDDAQVCKYCGERIEGQECPKCLSLNKHKAVVCRWCNFVFKKESKFLGISQFEVVAELLPTLILRFRLFPQKVQFTTEKIILSTPGFFALSTYHEEIPWHKVAGFDYRSGIFWDQATIQTRGQTSATIGCFNKKKGERIRKLLQNLEL
jgi:hypothetical protein